MIKKVCLLLCFAMMFMLVGCSNESEEDYSGNYNYSDDSSIAGDNNFSSQNSTTNWSDDGKTFFGKMGKFNGSMELAHADVQSNCNVEICFSGNISKGKAKLVLVKPDLSVETLKEIDSNKDSSYKENLYVACDIGTNKIKFVGENYKGNFEVSQVNERVFEYTGLFNKDSLFNN